MKISILASISCLLLSFGCSTGVGSDTGSSDSTSKSITQEVTQVRVKLAEYGDFSYELMSNGVVEAMNKAELRFLSNDNISRIYVKNGSHVVKGQKIADLDQFKFINSFNQAKDNLERAKLDLQDVLIGQGYSLKDSTSIPVEVMKIAKVRSGYEQSINNFEMARYNFLNSTLVAPFSGVVANLYSKTANRPADPFCLVINNSSPEIIFSVLEKELALLKIGDKVVVSPFAFPEYQTQGQVTQINPLVDRNGLVKVKAVAENTQGKLYEGMNVGVRVQRVLGKRTIVPKSAVVMRTNRKVVFTMQNQKAVWVYVVTGEENSQSIVITEGISAGDSVIFGGNVNLAHESPVILAR